MIEQLSPLTRKIVAVGILILLALLAVQYLIVPIGLGIIDARTQLADLRTRSLRLQNTIDRPLPPPSKIDPGQSLIAANAAQATARLQETIAGGVAVAGVALQMGPPCQGELGAETVCVQIAVAGPEIKVAHFLSMAERGAPVIRFPVWQMAPDRSAGGQMSFTGRAIATWRRP